MNILHVIAEMDPRMGGVCQAVRTIIAGLAELGVANEVVSLDAPDAPFLGADPFKVHALGPGKGPWAHSVKLIPWLVGNLARFDCVVVHGLWLYHTYAVRKAMRLFKRSPAVSTASQGVGPKLFIMPHGMLDPYFQRASGRKVKAARNWIYWKLIESHVINDADGLLFTCDDELRLAREPFRPYWPKREIVVGLGVENPPAYTPAMREAFLEKCPALHDSSYILFLSRLHEKKGVDLLLKAYAAVTAKAGKTQAALAGSSGSESETELPSIETPKLPKLVVAGPGLQTAYGQTLQQFVAQNQELQAAVLFPDMLMGDAKWGAFYTCDAFVLPSHQENFGIAVVEAMACGKPVLISNQVNIWREIEAGGGGLVADDTLEGTQKLLQKWEHLPEKEQQRMGEHARKTFAKDFATSPAAHRFLAALEE